MPWLECVLFIAAVYVVIVVVRGIVQGITWFREEFVTIPRERNRTEGKSHQQHRDSDATTALASGHRVKQGDIPSRTKRRIFLSFARLNPVRCLAPLAGFAKWLVCRKRYDYWVAVALGENDPSKKVKNYSRALKLDPSYEPGWKLKATTLLQLKRYAEAIDCFDKVLEIRPNATTWCKKGICCYHLKRYDEAVACFDKALAASADVDHELFEEASKCKKTAEEELRQQGATV